MAKKEEEKEILGIFTAKEFKDYYLKRDLNGMIMEAFARGLSQDQVDAIGEEWGKLKNQEVSILDRVKEVFKDDIEETKSFNDMTAEDFEEFKKAVKQAKTRVVQIKKEVKTLSKTDEKGNKAKIYNKDFIDYSIELDGDLIPMLYKYVVYWSMKYHDKIIELKSYYNCSRKEAEDRAISCVEYQRYKIEEKELESLENLAKDYKKKAGFDIIN